MSVTKIHSQFIVEADSTLIGAISQQDLVTDSDVRTTPSGSEPFPRFQALYGVKPRGRFTTFDLKAALDAIGMTGASIAAMTAGFKMYLQKHAPGGTRATGSSHKRYTTRAGIVVPRTLNIDHQGDATLDYEAVIAYDGSNAPVVVTDSVALPGSNADARRYTLAPTTLGGTTFNQKRSLSLDFGLSIAVQDADSDLYPTHVSIETGLPRLSLRGNLTDWFGSGGISISGLATSHANTSIFLRKRAVGGDYVADATAEHIKLTMAGMAVVDAIMSARGNSAAETTISLPARFDGTNNPVVINTAIAIS